MTELLYVPGQRPSLSAYTVRASVDWIGVRFKVPRLRQARHICSDLGTSWVDRCDSEIEPGSAFTPSGQEFIARFQDPKSAAMIKNRLHSIDASDIEIDEIEIALDFCPRSTPDRQEIAQILTQLFVGHQYPESTPRVGIAKNFGASVDSPRELLNRFGEGKTCYMNKIGKKPRRMQRAYLKQTDQGKELPDSEVRGRFENVYRRPEPIGEMLDGGWPASIYRDFSFRMLSVPKTAQEAAINARSLQVGARARRSNRLLFDPRTCADVELNGRAHDALRGLRKRWHKMD